MVALTERAKQHLKEVLQAKTTNPKVGMRLVRSDTGKLTLRFDMERGGDQVVHYEGSKVLLVDETVSVQVSKVTIDFPDNGKSASLFIASV